MAVLCWSAGLPRPDGPTATLARSCFGPLFDNAVKWGGVSTGGTHGTSIDESQPKIEPPVLHPFHHPVNCSTVSGLGIGWGGLW